VKTVIVGVGNDIVKDDGAGLFAVRLLKSNNLPNNVDVKESERGGIYLLDLLEGYDRAILIDAVKSGKNRIGELYESSLDDFKNLQKPDSLHSVDIISGLEFYKKQNIKVPDQIIIYSIEVENIEEFGVGLTPEVEKGVRKLVELIIQKFKQ